MIGNVTSSKNVSSKKVSIWVIVVIAAGSILSSLDLFIVNLAFSSIRDSFQNISNQTASWVLSSYTISFAAFLVTSGRIADIYGRKRVFQIGLLIFSIASIGCTISWDIYSLIFFRALKGIGAASMIPTSLGLLLAAYPKDKHKKMIAIWAATGSVAAAIGPTIGGILVEFNWRLIFLINLPIALPALWLTKHLIETEKKDQPFPDILGSLLLVLGIAFLITSICYVNEWGLTNPLFLVSILCSLLFLAFFIWRCFMVASPAIDLSLFRINTFTIAVAGMTFFYISFAMLLLGGPLYLIQIWHWDPILAGLAFGLSPLSAVISSLIAGKSNVSPKWLTIIAGFLFFVTGIWWYWMMGSQDTFWVSFIPGMILTGIGAGIGQTGFLSGGTARLSQDQYATGFGVINTSRQIGAALGVAIFVSVTGTGVFSYQYEFAWFLMASGGLIASFFALFLRSKKEINI